MTKKDFELIAKAINEIKFDDKFHQLGLAQHFAGRLQKTNPNFDAERFIKACIK